jgi:sugar lactone lactonase YvrE
LGILVTAILNEQGLKKETIAMMLKPAIKTGKSDQVLWGLGPGLVKTNCGDAFFQWGDNGAFKGFCIAFKKQKAGLVYLSNSSSGLSIAKDIISQALTADISALFPGFFGDNYPAHDSVYMQLIHTYLKKGINPTVEKMKKFLAKSKTKENSLFKEIHQLGQTIFEQGDYQGAVKILEFAAEGSPDSVPILMDLAKAYAGADQFDLSLQVMKKARALNLKKKEVKEADIDWTMEWVKAIKNPLKLSVDYLKKLEGDYSGRHIRLKEGFLYYFRDNASAENYRKLYPLSEDTFILKEISWFRLRFNKDKKGNIKKITGMYQSGETDDSLRDLPKKKESNKGNAEIVYRLPLENFFPEGMAYDPVDNCFYIGSLLKSRIIRIDMNGKYRDFIAPGQDIPYTFAGMRADHKRRVLWANVFSKSSKETGIFKFDLNTGQVLRKYLVPQKTENHLFNDVTVLADGSVYITGFQGGTVYHIDAKNGEMSVFLELGKDSWTNGIDITPGEKYLLIASNDDILRVDLGNKQVKVIQPPQGETLGYADGLYYYNGGILAVQHQRAKGKPLVRIARTYLDKEYLQGTKILVLEADHPAFRLPTTGAIVNDEFYFIATSYLDKWREKQPVVDPVLIMKVKIK